MKRVYLLVALGRAELAPEICAQEASRARHANEKGTVNTLIVQKASAHVHAPCPIRLLLGSGTGTSELGSFLSLAMSQLCSAGQVTHCSNYLLRLL